MPVFILLFCFDLLFLRVRIIGVSAIPAKTHSVCFTTKGQVVIPARLRREFDIQTGTKAVVEATPEGILLKPVTAVTVRRLRGILKRKPGAKPLAKEWAEHKREEKALDEAKHARRTSRTR